MNEITRIHIAKIPYEIEPTAKHEIEAYMEKLASYAHDDELLQDIEIRMTELLADRGIVSGGVIVSADVTAIIIQLGKPEDFMTDEGEALASESSQLKRKLYRNEDDAIVGGIMGGLAQYMKTDSLWPRLVFAILIFVTGGSILILYVLLWIIVPPARSSAEKLQMQGRPVTLASIKDLSQFDDVNRNRHAVARTIRRIGLILLGCFLAAAAIAAFITTAVAGYGLINYKSEVFQYALNSKVAYLMVALFMASGLLLTALLSLLSYVSFKRRITKRFIIGMIVVTALGCLTFGSAIGTFYYSEWQGQKTFESNTREESLSLPANFETIRALNVTNKNYASTVSYVVSNERKIVFQALAGSAKPGMNIKDGQLTVSIKAQGIETYRYAANSITIYGPALERVAAAEGNVSYSNGGGELQIEGAMDSSIRLEGGTYTAVNAKLETGATLSASEATVEQVTADMQSGSNLNLATIKGLAVTLPQACPTGQLTNINLDGISGGQFILNGTAQQLKDQNTTCLNVTFQPDSF